MNYVANRCIHCRKKKGGLWTSGHFHVPIFGEIIATWHKECDDRFVRAGDCKGCYGKRSLLWILFTDIYSLVWRRIKYHLYWKHIP